MILHERPGSTGRARTRAWVRASPRARFSARRTALACFWADVGTHDMSAAALRRCRLFSRKIRRALKAQIVRQKKTPRPVTRVFRARSGALKTRIVRQKKTPRPVTRASGTQIVRQKKTPRPVTRASGNQCVRHADRAQKKTPRPALLRQKKTPRPALLPPALLPPALLPLPKLSRCQHWLRCARDRSAKTPPPHPPQQAYHYLDQSPSP